MRLSCSSLTSLVVWLVLAGPAQAYVRTTTSSGAPMYWNRTVLEITAYVGRPPVALTPADVLQAATAAAATWSRSQLPCTSMEMRISSSPGDSAPVGLDGTSRLTFRREEWCREPRAEGEPCYDPFALAVTSVFARRTDGEILDADVELNGKFTWGDLMRDPRPGENSQDLQNTLTHEFGHLIGMDHTCTLSGERPGQMDNQGHAVPSCSRASQGIQATTMFAAVIPGDLDRRSLTDDDSRAVCEVYPALEPELDGQSAGCAVGGRQARPAGVALVLLALSVARRRRRAGRRPPATPSSTGPARRW
jgi:MYXO-CTERM domain-containing protein